MYDPDNWDQQEADDEMYQLQQAGRATARLMKRSLAARLRGDLDKAADLCPHGWTGKAGCYDCGSELDDTRRHTTRPCVRLPRCLRCNESLALGIDSEGRPEARCPAGHFWFLKFPAVDL